MSIRLQLLLAKKVRAFMRLLVKRFTWLFLLTRPEVCGNVCADLYARNKWHPNCFWAPPVLRRGSAISRRKIRRKNGKDSIEAAPSYALDFPVLTRLLLCLHRHGIGPG